MSLRSIHNAAGKLFELISKKEVLTLARLQPYIFTIEKRWRFRPFKNPPKFTKIHPLDQKKKRTTTTTPPFFLLKSSPEFLGLETETKAVVCRTLKFSKVQPSNPSFSPRKRGLKTDLLQFSLSKPWAKAEMKWKISTMGRRGFNDRKFLRMQKRATIKLLKILSFFLQLQGERKKEEIKIKNKMKIS